MKKKILLIVTAFLLMAVLPMLSLGGVEGILRWIHPSSEQSSTKEPSQKDEKKKTAFPSGLSFKILDTSSGKVVTVEDRSFCIGAVAYEMPPSFEAEALKAQCVACYTHFCRLRSRQRSNPDKELKGADFKANLSEGEFFLSDEILSEKWGDSYRECLEKVTAAVDDTAGEVMTDSDGSYIDAAYHAISSGETESAEDIFGKKDDHLLSCASPGDRLAPRYQSQCTVSEQEFKEKILSLDQNVQWDAQPEKWIGKIERTKPGTVKTIVIGGKNFDGAAIRTLFSLRSAHFSISHQNGEFCFSVIGYGHGVGMSQYGAEYMAQQGADFRQILSHYYHQPSFSSVSDLS